MRRTALSLLNKHDTNFICTVFKVSVVCLILFDGVHLTIGQRADNDVIVDLRQGLIKGYNRYISFLQRPTRPTQQACSSQAVVRISLPSPNVGLKIRLSYGKEVPRLWTAHVSDSPNGKGLGGDDDTTSNNAELHVRNRQMRLYGNQLPNSIDAAMNGGRLIKIYDSFIRQESKITLDISDERFEWWTGGGAKKGDVIESPILFTLNGQKPTFGIQDDFIYLGLNRVVGAAFRNGSGLCHVNIKVQESSQHCVKGTHNCHQDAICTDTRKSFRCRCKPGFNGDGRVCIDENECEYENGGCVHRCVNTPGSYHCACLNGYRLLADSKGCDDVNECFKNKGGCAQQCINTLGGFECSCSKGYSLDKGGYQCIYGDWCLSRLGCSHGCHNIPSNNQIECYCREGYHLHNDGKTCIPKCSHGNGGCHHVCTDSEIGPVCSCAPKYVINIDGKSCIATCSVSNGGCERKCNDSPQGPVCSCPTGFKLHQDKKTCLDLDECETGEAGCSHHCENTKGSFECVCPTGFKVSVDYKTCEDIDECKLETACDHRCENLPGSFLCHCKKGYQKFGITHCADKNECADRNGGCAHSCTNTDGGYMCSCVPGYKLHTNGHDCIDSHQCTKLRVPRDVHLECASSHNGDNKCTVSCKGNGQLVSGYDRDGNGLSMLDTQNIKIWCGSSTDYKWKGINNDTLPKCSKQQSAPSYERMAQLVFFKDSCNFDDISLEHIRLNLTRLLNEEKRYKCSNRCGVTYIDLECGSRRKKYKRLMRRQGKRVIVTAEFGLEMGPKSTKDDCNASCTADKNMKRFHRIFKKLRQAIKRRKLSLKIEGRDYKAIKKSLKTDKRILSMCPHGSIMVNNICVGCLPGYAFDNKTHTCQPCPRGTYQDINGQSTCKSCPDALPGGGRPGADTLEHCYDECEPGTYSRSGTKPCLQCGIGTFQPHYGRTSCVPCGGGLSTSRIGSNDFSHCIAKVVCKPGTFYSTVSDVCVKCALGFYQPTAGQEYCKACPGNTTTDFMGATSPEDCKDRTCRQHKGDYFGILESPNYPGNYPINVECVWKIRPEKKRRILIIVPEIALTDADQCGDFITMRKKKSKYSQSTFETCESRQRPIAFTARSKKLWIQFRSDGNHTAKGFSIPFVTYNDEYQSLIEDIVSDGRLYSSKQHQQIFQDRQLLTALLEVIATPYSYLKYANVTHTMFPESFFRLLKPKVHRFFRT